MSKLAPIITCSPENLVALQRIANSTTQQFRMVNRANIVLDCIAGMQNKEVAANRQVTLSVVRKWRSRFAVFGLSGLLDKPRSGKPPKYPKEQTRQDILQKLSEPPPSGLSVWDGGSIAEALGISSDQVWRVLRKENIQLARQRSWCVSTDKEFAAKSADIIGLYLNPPANAIVISVDEKPSIQALERKTGYVCTSSGKIVRGIKSTYKRHGTVNLFAALNVATGAIQGKTTQTKKRQDFQAFMEEVVADLPKEKEVHVILDNYSTHKKNDEWLEAHPQVKFHYTPTSASWLNMVEIWFGILSRKTLRAASFSNQEELITAIESFIKRHNESAHPFVWRKREVRGAQIRDTIINLCN